MDVCENMCQIYTHAALTCNKVDAHIRNVFVSDAVDAALQKVGRAAAGEFIFHQLKKSSVHG